MDFKTNHQLVNEIDKLLKRLDEGKLPLNELEELVQHSQELYQRAIVLRYKAFEDFVSESNADFSQEKLEESATNLTQNLSEDKNEEVQEELSFDLGMFETHVEPEEPKQTETNEPDDVEFIEEAPANSESSDVSEPMISEESHVSISKTNDSTYYKLFKELTQVHGAGVGHSKLDSLIGAFGLNERLQYINELFDGSSEQFSEAIKALDAMKDLDAAYELAASFAEKNNWIQDSETIVEFIQKLNRRYA